MRVVLAGNPNVGKTSLFNCLSGARHRVGNYAGVTIERRECKLTLGDRRVTLVDLPGTYSLTPVAEDERIAYQEITGELGTPPNLVLVVVDASNLARNLYFVHQIAELGLPYAVLLNMVDVAQAQGHLVSAQDLSQALGVPVVPTSAHKGGGIGLIKEMLASINLDQAKGALASWGRRPLPLSSPEVESCVEVLSQALSRSVDATFAGPVYGWICSAAAATQTEASSGSQLAKSVAALDKVDPQVLQEAAAAIVDARYAQVDALLRQLKGPESSSSNSFFQGAPTKRGSERIDAVLTHPVWGPCAFLLVMGLLFQAMYSGAEPFVAWVESGVAWSQSAVTPLLGEGMLSELVREGVLAGVGNVLVFVPQIALLFFGIGILEDSGYMARAAFLADKVMAKAGLNGRSFLPLLSGYACAVPAILGTRSLSSFRVRLVTMLMIPYTSCSARLPVYFLLLGAFFPVEHKFWGVISWGSLVLLGIYFISLVSALGVGWLLRKTILPGPTPTLVLELPPYRRPRLRNVLREVWDRVRDFCRDAGTIILCFTIVMWGLLNFPRQDTGDAERSSPPIAQSYAGRVGHLMEPALEPIGQDWRVGVGIVSSFAAREVFVSTMGLVYGIEDSAETDDTLKQKLANAKDEATGKPRYSPLSALALIVFFIYSAQCMSTLAVLKRESRSWAWPIFAFVSMTLIAYLGALLVYQVGLHFWPNALL